jgi:hypothetical protein
MIFMGRERVWRGFEDRDARWMGWDGKSIGGKRGVSERLGRGRLGDLSDGYIMDGLDTRRNAH